MAAEPEVSLVIVTWNSGRVIGALLDSLVANPPSRPWEAVVVDNGSGDDTVAAVEAAAQRGIRVRVVANRSNRGLAAANNQGMLAARGDYLVISNPDVEYLPGAVDALVALLDRRPRAAFAFARLQSPSGAAETCTGDLPSLREALAGRAARLRRPDQRPRGFWWHGWSHDDEVQIGHGGEACYATRRDVVAAIGLQDERFRLDWEGIDWTARAIGAGYEVWFCPAARVVHRGGESVRRAPLRWIVSTHRGLYRYFADRSPRPVRPLLAAAVAARAAVKAGASWLGASSYDAGHQAPTAGTP